MIDILMAVYNGEAYLKEQLESIADQTYKDWRLVIRDDCSTDRSMAVIREFKKEHPELWIELYENETPTGSACKNFMRLLKDAHEDYVMFCDQDDVWLPYKIQKTIKCMHHVEREEGTEDKPFLIHSDLIVVDENLKTLSKSLRDYQKLPKSTELKQLLIQNSVTGCTVMINKPLRKMLLEAEHAEHMAMHDYWAALIAQTYGRIHFIPRPLIRYRQHGGNSVGAMNAGGLKFIKKRAKLGRSDFRMRLLETMAQAKEFAEIYKDYDVDPKRMKLIRQYGDLADSGKMKKLLFYTTHGVTKYGKMRTMMQYIWS